MKRRHLILGSAALVGSKVGSQVLPALAQSPPAVELTLVSYAVAKPLFAKIIPEFQKEWKTKTGQEVRFKESYGGTFPQARAILEGLEADIFPINTQAGIDILVERGFIRPDWAKRLPNNAVPATSIMVIVTRPGNPRQIKTWQDLTRDGVQIVSINPKTSGNARWGILAGYGAILKTQGQTSAKEYLNKLVRNSRTTVNTGREATDTFVRNRIGDVMINFENEIIFTNDSIPKDFPFVAPSPNIQVDFPVAVVDRVVDKKGTRRVAEAFAKFLFSSRAQQIYADLGYRPRDQRIRQLNAKQYAQVAKQYKISDFGGWPQVNRDLFADGALFDLALRAAQ
jgi:sulfate transport system substrate-binding protein